MNNEEWFIINNIDEFVDKTRTLVFNNFGKSDDETDIDSLLNNIKPEDQEEFDRVLSHDESIIIMTNLAKKQKNKKNNKIRYLISDSIFYEIIQSFNDRMISNLLNTLVNKGLVETAFDDKTNDFIFWVKNNENNNTDRKDL
jgi:DNA-binding HxlR family transcriptional regulator